MKKILLTGSLLLAVLLFVGRTYATQTFSITICHHTPANAVTLTFHTLVAYLGHLGTPHSGQTYDTAGVCPSPTPTPTDEPSPIPTEEVTPTPTINPCLPNLELTNFVSDRIIEDCITPSPTVEPTVTPEPPQQPATGFTEADHNQSKIAPQCPDGNVLTLVGNVRVIRNGSDATVEWQQTAGNRANIYYKEVGQANWTHAVADIEVDTTNPNVSYPIHELNPNLGYIFGVEQHIGCGGGQLATSVVIDGPVSTTFTFSYWQWSY